MNRHFYLLFLIAISSFFTIVASADPSVASLANDSTTVESEDESPIAPADNYTAVDVKIEESEPEAEELESEVEPEKTTGFKELLAKDEELYWLCGSFILFVLVHSLLNMTMDFSEDSIKSNQSVDDQISSPEETLSPVASSPKMSDDLAAEIGLQVWRLRRRIAEFDLEEHPKLHRKLSESAEKFAEILQSNNIVVNDFENDVFMDGSFDFEVRAWEYLPEESIPEGVGQKPFVLRALRPRIVYQGRVIAKAHIIVGELKGEDA